MASFTTYLPFQIINMRLTLLLILFTITVNAQKSELQPEMCGSETIHYQLMNTDSVYAKKANQFEAQMKLSANRNSNSTSILIVPVVVHIMHKGEAIGVGSNISDQAVYNKLKAINDNYRRTIGTDGYRNGVDTGIEFALAVRDPNGLCTTGIERINMSSNTDYMTYGVNYGSGNGVSWANLTAISSWNPSQYYNLYMVSEIDNNEAGNGTQGFANFPSSHGLPGDGAVFLANPTSTYSYIGNTETHELGHSLNLYHTFEGDGTFGATCPSATGCGPGVGDCCNDTPPHKRSTFSCNMSGTNECDNNSLNSLIASNYMNYTSCMDMFTEDQKNRMRTTLTTIRASFLIENGSLSLIPNGSPTPNYSPSGQSICAGESIQFYDRSSCIPNFYSTTAAIPSLSFHWVFTNGATTVSATTENPLVRFILPGNYTLTYTVTNSLGTNTITVPNTVTVNNSSTISCTPTSDYVGPSGHSISHVGFNTISKYSGYTNEGYRDFSCIQSTVVSRNQLYYFYITPNSSGFLNLNLYTVAYIDYNSNGIFETNEKIFELTLGPQAGSNEHYTAVTIPNDAVINTNLRMRVISSTTPITDDLMNCNVSYSIGDIEDYAVTVLDPLANPDFTRKPILLYPNPIKDNLAVESPVDIDKIQIYTNLGQLLLDNNYIQKKVTLEMSSYSKGIYFVGVFSEGKPNYFKIIKE